MGPKFAPNYVNIMMDMFERTHLPNAPIKLIIWKRFIDDVFAVFVATDKEIEDFKIWLNNQNPNIQFTSEMNTRGIPSLDTFCTIENSKIRTRPYVKPTDTRQYLDPTSCHPLHIIKAIPYSQAMKYKGYVATKKTLTKN